MNAFARSTLPVLNVLGYVVMIFAATMLVPLGFALVGGDKALKDYDLAVLITAGAGLLLVLLTRRHRRELQPRDGFLLVTLVWTVLPAFATLPLMLHLPGMTFTHAYFETMSGLTTTGATVLSGLDSLPLSINIWRHLLVWIGGMGILVLVVAILPLLGVGGSQAFKAETAGPFKESKLTPRIADTAKALYAVYFGISLACFFAYRWAGMSWSDAFMHMCSTMGLGGFSSHDASFGHWNSPLIEFTAVFFMVLAGFNFSMHFLALRRRSLLVYLRDPESKAYFLTLLRGVPAGGGLPAGARRVCGLAHRLAVRSLQRRVDRDDDRVHQHRLQPMAHLRAGADALPLRLHHLRRIDRRRRQDDPWADPAEAGATRNDAHHPSARHQPGHRR